MNRKDILHAPDIEDSNYIEEDYLDKDDRKIYEKNIQDFEQKIIDKARLPKIEKQALNNDPVLREKVESSVNDATRIL